MGVTGKTGIHTVLGVVDASAIGSTDCHAHLFIRGGLPVLQYPDFRLVDEPRITGEVREFLAAGGCTLVEMSPIDWGRDARSLARLAQSTGVQIVAATGFHKLSYYDDIHWLHAYSEEQLVGLIVAELLEGLDAHAYSGPIVERTAARAGVIKVGTMTGRFSPVEEKLLNVVAEAHRRTNAPIITHTDEGALALEQVRYLTDLGVAPGRLALSHVDRRVDPAFHGELAASGVFLEYDSLTRCGKGLDATVVGLVRQMVDGGWAGSVLLGSDISRQGYWRHYGGGPGLSFLPGAFREQLGRAGLEGTVLERIYVDNPRALLQW